MDNREVACTRSDEWVTQRDCFLVTNSAVASKHDITTIQSSATCGEPTCPAQRRLIIIHAKVSADDKPTITSVSNSRPSGSS